MNNPFDEIIGQNEVKKILIKILESKRIPHAILFTGKEGVGKEFTAIQLAKYLVYKSKATNKEFLINSISNLNEPFIKYICALPRGKNEKETDSAYDKLKETDLKLIQEEFQKKAQNPYYEINIPNANNIKINSIRDIANFISYAEQEDYKRIILISNAHLMKEEAQNALLKNLEEPPRNVIFILTTPYPELLRETILSRCWRINFETLKPEEIEKILTKYFELDSQIASKVSEISLGSVKTAIQYLMYDLDFLTDKVIKILRFSFGRKFHQALIELESIEDKNFLKIILSLIILWLYYYNKYRFTKFQIPLSQFDETIKKFTVKYPKAEVFNLIQVLEDFQNKIDRNINVNIIYSNLVVKLSSII